MIIIKRGLVTRCVNQSTRQAVSVSAIEETQGNAIYGFSKSADASIEYPGIFNLKKKRSAITAQPTNIKFFVFVGFPRLIKEYAARVSPKNKVNTPMELK